MDALELVKIMEDRLRQANEADDIEHTTYFGHAAICYGILALLAEIKNLRDTIEESVQVNTELCEKKNYMQLSKRLGKQPTPRGRADGNREQRGSRTLTF